MNKILPLVILAVGLVISAAFGARIGEHHARYRVANAAVGLAEGDAARDAAVAARDAIGLPTPRARVAAWFAEGGVGWLFGVILILAGAGVARRQLAAEQDGSDGASAQADFPATVRAALDLITALEGSLAELPMDADSPEARDAIDRLMDETIGPLVDARGQLVAKHGLGTFAEYFGAFSGGERNLARVWSAITDGHAIEARRSLGSARASFEQALALWHVAESRSWPGPGLRP